MSDELRPRTPVPRGTSLEDELGKPRAEWTGDDLVGLVRNRGIQIVSLMHVGGDGWLKTLDFVPRSAAHFKDIIDGGERADGSNLFPRAGIPVHASDIVLKPRVSTAFLDPFASLPTLVLMCGHADPEGHPLPASPDTILRRAVQQLKEVAGVELWALGEVEYFLGKRRDESDIYGADDRGYHASSPFVFGEGLRRKALALLADLGVPVKYGHSEVGYIEASEAGGVIWEQHEIELALAILLTQWVLRNLAHRKGMRCATGPMMLEGHAGNGLHFHLAPVRDGEVLPVKDKDKDGALTDAARWLIGLVQLGGALMAFGNRVEGSFVRIRQAKEAPSTIVWGEYDRLALIRLPVVTSDEDGRVVTPATVEFRLPDGSVLPHLLLAGAALAMIKGRDTEELEDLLQRTSATLAREGKAGRAERVPRDFYEVADALARHRDTLESGGVFQAELLDNFLAKLRS
jgi:glutamine synthetase